MLQSQLGITEAQMPLWSAFTQAMRDNAAATDALFTQRAGAVSTMNAPDNMHSYAQIARAYADNPERLATAFDSLYASLSDTQKQAADTMFRQQATAAAQPRPRPNGTGPRFDHESRQALRQNLDGRTPWLRRRRSRR